MAGRRILNRKDLRADYEAAERRKQDEDELEDEDEELEDEEEAEAEANEEEGEEDEEEEAPKKKAVAKEAKPKRSRSAKQVRMKVVWGVFNNSNQRVATFDYPKKQEAIEHAAKLQAAKTPPQPFFVQPVKEPMEEK